MSDWEEIYWILAGESEEQTALTEAWGPGESYETAHRALADARDRLCERFSIHPEDKDLEEMMNAVLQIEKDISRRAYQWGMAAWNGETKEY